MNDLNAIFQVRFNPLTVDARDFTAREISVNNDSFLLKISSSIHL
jgi:hypothetical protein